MESEFKEITSGDHIAFLEDPGVIIIEHNDEEVCGESNEDGKEDVVKLEESMSLPSYVTDATIFLNGWKLKYFDPEHHVRFVRASLEEIELVGNVLNWVAIGAWSSL
jgi:hypothetical protein